MYQRLNELKKYQKNQSLTTLGLSKIMGIDLQTVRRVIDGGKIHPSMSRTIDNFLDSPHFSYDVDELIQFKSDHPEISIDELAESIGVASKTIRNVLNQKHELRQTTKKLIQNYLISVK